MALGTKALKGTSLQSGVPAASYIPPSTRWKLKQGYKSPKKPAKTIEATTPAETRFSISSDNEPRPCSRAASIASTFSPSPRNDDANPIDWSNASTMALYARSSASNSNYPSMAGTRENPGLSTPRLAATQPPTILDDPLMEEISHFDQPRRTTNDSGGYRSSRFHEHLDGTYSPGQFAPIWHVPDFSGAFVPSDAPSEAEDSETAPLLPRLPRGRKLPREETISEYKNIEMAEKKTKERILGGHLDMILGEGKKTEEKGHMKAINVWRNVKGAVKRYFENIGKN